MDEQLGLKLDCAALGEVTPLRLQLTESISAPVCAEVSITTEQELDPEPALGKPAVVRLLGGQEEQRRWTLVVTGVRYDAQTLQGRHRYVVELDHELALLKLRSNMRMFQEKTTQEIVTEVLDAAGISPARLDWRVARTLPQREYCVQHRESDFAFISRLLEHEGIFYVCLETDDGPLLVFADSPDVFEPFDEAASSVPMLDGHGEGVGRLEIEHVMTPDVITLNDYNFKAPGVDLLSTFKISEPVQGTVYEYPGGYSTQEEGAALARVRAEEIAARRTVGRGRSGVLRFRPGTWFKLEETGLEHVCIQYLLREVTHRVRAEGYRPEHEASEDYSNSFVCSPLSQPFRPQRQTEQPRTSGSQSVVVTGPAGEEIHTDEYGRMKGKFFWDRLGQDDDTSSCWMRVLQHPIGGSMALARVGWEMTVRFLEGDADRPVAMYRVDNAGHAAPYQYPAAASAMAFKTLSSPGGGKHNELKMEDGGGGMVFALTGSKDASEVVNNNKTEKVAVNEELNVGVNMSTEVTGNQTVDIGAMLTKSVGADAGLTVAGDRTKTIGAAETVTVGGNEAEIVAGSDTETVGASHTTIAAQGVVRTAVGSHALTVGGSMISAAASDCSVATAGSRSETVGAVKLVASGSSISESMVGALALNVGGVYLNAAGGSHSASATGNSSLTVGGVVLANAGGQLQISGKEVTINVGGVANLMGGGGILNLTPGSAAFVGIVGLKASGAVKLKGSPNLAG